MKQSLPCSYIVANPAAAAECGTTMAGVAHGVSYTLPGRHGELASGDRCPMLPAHCACTVGPMTGAYSNGT